MKEFTLTFTGEELQFLANVLATRPYSEVASLIGKIDAQATEQSSEQPTLEVVED